MRNGCGEIAGDDVPTEDELEGGDVGVRRHELSSLSCSGRIREMVVVAVQKMSDVARV